MNQQNNTKPYGRVLRSSLLCLPFEKAWARGRNWPSNRIEYNIKLRRCAVDNLSDEEIQISGQSIAFFRRECIAPKGEANDFTGEYYLSDAL